MTLVLPLERETNTSSIYSSKESPCRTGISAVSKKNPHRYSLISLEMKMNPKIER